MSTWNDKRLDELSARTDAGFKKVDERFDKVDQEFKAVRAEMKAGFEKVDEEFKAVRAEMKAGFTRVDDQLLRLSHILITGGIVLIAALVGAIGSILATGFLG